MTQRLPHAREDGNIGRTPVGRGYREGDYRGYSNASYLPHILPVGAFIPFDLTTTHKQKERAAERIYLRPVAFLYLHACCSLSPVSLLSPVFAFLLALLITTHNNKQRAAERIYLPYRRISPITLTTDHMTRQTTYAQTL